MKKTFNFIVFCIATLLLLSVAGFFFALSNNGDTPLPWEQNVPEKTHAEKILHSITSRQHQGLNTIALNEHELTVVTQYLFNLYYAGAVQVHLKQQQLDMRIQLPYVLANQYVLISLSFIQQKNNPLPLLDALSIGNVKIPKNIVRFSYQQFINASTNNAYFELAFHSLKKLDLSTKRMVLTYFSQFDSLFNPTAHLSTSEQKTLRLYQNKLNEIVQSHNQKWLLSLAELLKPLFTMAQQRSSTTNPIVENRLAIIAINEYINKNSSQFLFATQAEKQLQHYTVFLYKRGDLAQHFIASASLSATLNNHLSVTLGEQKELRDAKMGSGFSFIDLAADKAGSYFGEMATLSLETAQLIQKNMSAIKDYRDFMPDPRDLPENINHADFLKNYGSVNAENYKKLTTLIDQKISSMPIYAK
ncbi:MAG: hypothetical protein ACOYM1_01995 [Methylovulum sp.]|jgi:hypothetical protein